MPDSVHTLLLKVEEESKKARVALATLGEQLDNFGRKKVIATAEVETNIKQTRSQVSAFVREFRKVDLSKADPKIRLQASEAFAELKLLDRTLKNALKDKEINVDFARDTIAKLKAKEAQIRGILESAGGHVTAEVRLEADKALADAKAVKTEYRKIDGSTLTSEVKLDIKEAMIEAAAAEAALRELTKKKTIDVELAGRLTQQLAEANAKVRAAFAGSGQEVTIKVRADIAEAMRDGKELELEYQKLDTRDVTTEAKLNARNAVLEIRHLQAELKELTKKKVIDVELSQKLLGELAIARAAARDTFADIEREGQVRIEVKDNLKEKLADVRVFQENLRKLDTTRADPQVKLDIKRALIEAAVLERTLTSLSRDRNFKMNLASDAINDAEKMLGRLGGAFDDIDQNFGTIDKSATRFGRVMKGLTPFIAGVAAIIAVALVPAILAMVGSIGAAIGAIGALAAAMIASLGPAIALLIGLFSRLAAVFSAKQAQDQARAVGARNAGQASKQAAGAARQEAAAADAVRDANEQLTTARRSYTEAVKAARKAIRDSAVEEANAIRKVAEAERDLRKARSGLREAKTQAKDDIAQALQKRTDATEEFNRATQNVADQVIAANRAMEDAINAVRDAEIDLREKALDLEDAKDKVSDLEKEIDDLGKSAGKVDLGKMIQKLSNVDLKGFDVSGIFSNLGLEEQTTQTEKLSDLLRELEHAKIDVEKATNDQTDAETTLSRAQQEQAKFVKDGINAYGPYVDAVERAGKSQRDLTDASKEYNKLSAAGIEGAKGVKEAYERVGNAVRTLAQANRDAATAEREHNKLVAQGIQNAPAVIAAAEGVRDAQQGIATANRNAAASFDDVGGRAAQSMAAAQQQINKLSEAEKRFLDFIPKISKALRETIQGGSDAMLTSIQRALTKIGPLLAGAEPIFTKMGSVWGAAIEQAAAALTGPRWTSALKAFGDSAIALSAVGAQAFGAFAETFRNIAEAALPSLARVTLGIRQFFRGTASGTGDTKSLAKTIGGLTDHLELWLSLTWELTRAFGGFVSAVNEPAKEFVGWIRDAAAGLAEWTNSEEGQKRIQKFFKDTLPLAKELGKFIVNFGILFFQVFEFIAPALTDFFKGVNLAMKVLIAIMEVLDRIPAPIRSIIVAFIPFAGWASKIDKVGVAFKLLLKPLEAIPVLGGLIERTFTKIAGATAIFMHIGGSLAEGLVNGFVGALKGIVDFLDKIVEAVKKFFGIGSPSKLFADIGKDLALGLIEGFKAVIDLIGQAAKFLFDSWKKAIEAYLDAYVGVGTWIVARVLDGLKAIGDLMADAAKFLFNAYKTAVETYVSAYIGVGLWIIGKIIAGLQAVAGLVAGAAAWLFNGLKKGIESYVAAYLGVGKFIIRTIASGITTAVDAITGFGGWISDRLTNAANAAGPALLNVGKGIIRAIGDGIRTAVDAITGFGSWIGDALGKAIHAGEWLKNVGIGILKGIWEGLESAKDWFIDKVENLLPSWIKKGLKMLSPAKTMFPVGKGVVQGIAVGMAKSHTELTQASADLADAIQIPAPSLAIGDAKLDASGIVKSLDKSLKQVGDLGDNAGKTIVDSVSQGIEQTDAPLTDAAGVIQGTFSDGLTALDRLFAQTGAAITETIAGGAQIIGPLLKGFGAWLFGQLQSSVHAQAPNLTTLGLWITQTILNAARAATGAVAPFGSTLRGAIEADVKRLDWTYIGDWAAKQIVHGMEVAVNTQKEVQGFAEALIGSVKEAFGIHSPSKVFMGLGEMITQGFMMGMLTRNPTDVIRSQFGGMTRFARGLVLNAPDWIPGKKDAGGLFKDFAQVGLELWSRDDMKLGSIPDKLFASIMDLPASVVNKYFDKDSQQDIASIIVAVGKSLGATVNELWAGLAGSLAESGLKNLKGGDRDSAGIFQQRPSVKAWGTLKEILNPFHAAESFFRVMIRNRPHKGDVADWAQAVQHSAFSDASNYRVWLADAADWLKKLGVTLTDNIKQFAKNPKIGAGGGEGDLFAGDNHGHVPPYNKFATAFLNSIVSPIARKFGLHVGGLTGDGHATFSYHKADRARDYSNGWETTQEMRFAMEAIARWLKRLRQLIHTPLGFGISDGKRVPLSFWGAATNAIHHDHVHVAMAKGGLVRGPVSALLGEGAFQEAVLPLSARVFKMLADSIVGALDLSKLVTQVQLPQMVIQPKVIMPAIQIPTPPASIPGPQSVPSFGGSTFNINVPATVDGGQPDARATAALLELELRRRGGLG